jgi:hypothetical protein
MANWPIKKTIKVGNEDVSTVATKFVRPDHAVIIEATATVGQVSYIEMWTLPHHNPTYSKEQAQKDFDAHLLKVATETVGRATAHDVSEQLE